MSGYGCCEEGLGVKATMYKERQAGGKRSVGASSGRDRGGRHALEQDNVMKRQMWQVRCQIEHRRSGLGAWWSEVVTG